MKFRNFVIQNFPYLEDDFDALTDYELFCKMIGYMKKMSKQFNDFQIKLDKYENYFNNLDVQEEIDNKLDEMAESGELEQIIAQYLELNTIKVFDTVSDLHDAENLSNGTIVQTMGYASIGDGGSSKYLIRTITIDDTIDGYTLIELTNYPTLLAEIIIPDLLNVHQFGIFGDGETDVTNRLEKAFTYDCYIPKGTYIISNRLSLNNHLIYGDGCKDTIIKLADDSTFDNDSIFKTSNGISGFTIRDIGYDGNNDNNTEYKNFLTLYNSNNIVIENIEVSNSKGGGIKLNDSIDIVVNNCNFKNLDGTSGSTSPAIYGNPVNNLTIDNCRCDNIADHFLYLTSDDENKYSKNVIVKNCVLTGCGKDALTAGSALCIYANSQDVIIDNCIIKSNRSGINISYHGEYAFTPKNIIINNCIIDTTTLSAITINGLSTDKIKNIKISNCDIKNITQDGIYTKYTESISIQANNLYDCIRCGISSEYSDYVNIFDVVLHDNATGILIGSNGHATNNVHIYNSVIYDNTNGLYLNVGEDMKIYQSDIYSNTNNIVQNAPTKVSYINMIDRISTNYNVTSLTLSNRIPTAGDYNIGDIVLYNTPSAGGYIGAVCVTAGTPGTWKEFGSIQS